MCCQRTPRSQISWRRLLEIATKPQNLQEFSPSKVWDFSLKTLSFLPHWHHTCDKIYQAFHLAKFMQKTWVHSLCIPEELFHTASNKQGYLYLQFLYVTSDLRSGNKGRLVHTLVIYSPFTGLASLHWNRAMFMFHEPGNKARLVGGKSQVSFLLWVSHNWKVPELKGNILHVFLNQPLVHVQCLIA